ncbi:hypothetical protein GGR57DRAFT_45188 [Xylariaceae sp. FL1272]|nr:hypothetical protein GGR57DRAFT_45188 [Xylariaceae sp. FL1272]
MALVVKEWCLREEASFVITSVATRCVRPIIPLPLSPIASCVINLSIALFICEQPHMCSECARPYARPRRHYRDILSPPPSSCAQIHRWCRSNPVNWEPSIINPVYHVPCDIRQQEYHSLSIAVCPTPLLLPIVLVCKFVWLAEVIYTYLYCAGLRHILKRGLYPPCLEGINFKAPSL